MPDASATTTPGRPIASASSAARAVLDHGSDRIHGHAGRLVTTMSAIAPT
jgi:hypothetical protein